MGTTGPAGSSFINPPKSLDIIIHNFIDGTADTSIPPSLASTISSLSLNEYLIRGNTNGIQFISAYVYNPGTLAPEQYYDAYNVIPGDWLANDSTGFTWKITEIYSVSDAPNPGNNTESGVFYAKMVDVDGFNAGLDQGSTFNGAPAYVDSRAILFTVNEDGFPIFTPAQTFHVEPNFSGNVLGRFQILNTYNQYVSIYQPDAINSFSVGDSVYIDNTGVFQSCQRLGVDIITNPILGIITSLGVPNVDYFTFNPFGEFRKAADVPLSGPPGTLFYIDPTNTSQYTTTISGNFPSPIYQIIDPTGNSIILKSGGSGSASYTGLTGPTGPYGGPPGPRGSTGYTGPTGVMGPRGAAGSATHTGATGAAGPTGESFVLKTLPSKSYYVSTPISAPPSIIIDIIYDSFDPTNSNGDVKFTYDPITGLLTNLTSDIINILVSGQLQTDNDFFDLNISQPSIYVVKNLNNIISSSVINYEGSSFSTSITLYPDDYIKITFKQSFDQVVNVLGG